MYLPIFTESNHTKIISLAYLAASTGDQHGRTNNQRPSPSSKVFLPSSHQTLNNPPTTHPHSLRGRARRLLHDRGHYFFDLFILFSLIFPSSLLLLHSVSIKSRRLLVHDIVFPDCPLRNGFNNLIIKTVWSYPW